MNTNFRPLAFLARRDSVEISVEKQQVAIKRDSITSVSSASSTNSIPDNTVHISNWCNTNCTKHKDKISEEADSIESFSLPDSEEEFSVPKIPSESFLSGSNGLQAKNVRFNLYLNEYHESEREMTLQECRMCWWSGQELNMFRQDQLAIVKWFFTKPSPKDPKRRRQVCTRPNYATKVNNHKSNPHQWRKIMSDAYLECRKVDRGDMTKLTGQVDREALAQLYRDFPDLVGLEVYILYALRGPVDLQVNRILKYQRESQRMRGGPEKSQAVFLQTTRALTQPSSVFVLEIALAQAAALED